MRKLSTLFILLLANVALGADDSMLFGVKREGFALLPPSASRQFEVGRVIPSAIGYRLDETRGLVDIGSTDWKIATFNADNRTWTCPAPWGTLKVQLTPAESSLKLNIRLEASTEQVVDRVTMKLLTLRSSIRPPQWREDITYGTERPGIASLVFGESRLAVSSPDLDGKMQIGLTASEQADASGKYRIELIADTEVRKDREQPPAVTAERPLNMELEFGVFGLNSDMRQISPKAVQSFLAVNPATLNWPDRRPIGRVFLSSTAEMHKSPTNPRGWFNDPTVDITTPQGLAGFKRHLMDRARTVIGIATKHDAQGVIVWDLEGGEFPHPITFLGDPRTLATAAPEMDVFADEFFEMIRAADLRVGVCIRPSRIEFNVNAGTGERSVFHDNMDFDVAKNLIAKIEYCKKRWNATLFYLDTNVEWFYNRDGEAEARLLAPQTLRQVTAAHPDVLIIPEFMHPAYYAVAAGYGELRPHAFGHAVGTPLWIRQLYPDAMRVLTLEGGDVEANADEIVRNIAKGDTVFVDTWWDNPHNQQAINMYKKAAGK